MLRLAYLQAWYEATPLWCAHESSTETGFRIEIVECGVIAVERSLVEGRPRRAGAPVSRHTQGGGGTSRNQGRYNPLGED